MGPFWHTNDDIRNELSAATGIISGVAISLALWLAAVDVWLFFR